MYYQQQPPPYNQSEVPQYPPPNGSHYTNQYPPNYSSNPPVVPLVHDDLPTYSEQNDRTPLKDKFSNSTYRDVLFVILFIIHAIGLGAILVAGIVKHKKTPEVVQYNTTSGNDTTVYTSNVDETTFVLTPSDITNLTIYIGICLACAICGLVIAFLYLVFIKRHPRQVIISTLVMSVILWLAAGVSMIVLSRQLIWGIILCIIALFNAWMFYLWRDRIPFASIMLRTVATVIEEYPATTYTAYLSSIIQFLFVFVWAVTVVLAQNFSQNVFAGLFVFLLLSYYWTTQVIKNVVHVTVSGVFATWYFMKSSLTGEGAPSNPTLGSFKRATTTSFGSICLGSLLVAALQTIRALIQFARNGKHQILVLIVDCIVGCIDQLLQYFNKYAFTQVAIYGKTYITAARDTWRLIKSHGIQAIINDNLISGVLSIGALIGGIMCGGVGAALGYSYIRDYWISTTVAGFIIGFVMVLLTMEVVDSGVATIFVAFAMDHEAMKRNHPDLHTKFRERYSNYNELWN